MHRHFGHGRPFWGRDDEHAAVRELDAIAETAREEGLVARYGRKILEVLPPVGSHKGTAVRHLIEERGLQRALAAGDDTTDIDSFAALDGLEVAVRVAVASKESPQLLVETADVVVGSTAGVPRAPAEAVEPRLCDTPSRPGASRTRHVKASDT